MADELTREQLLDAAQTLRTIVDYRKWRDDVRRLVEDIHGAGSPIEYLCLSVGGSPGAFPELHNAVCWVKQYRAEESQWMQESSNSERAGLPIGILVATDQPPSDLESWREDCAAREALGSQGAMLLDRSESRAGPADEDLFLEIIAVASGNPAFVPKTQAGGGFDFGWAPSDPVGSFGAEYGRQPSSINAPDNDKYFAQRFDAYTPGSSDVEF